MSTSTWLDKLLGVIVQASGVDQPRHSRINFATGFTVTENIGNDSLDVVASGGSGVTLAGDLLGTGSTSLVPRVGTITGVAGTLALATTAAAILWAAATVAPSISQTTTGSPGGQPLAISAQTGNTTGGALVMSSGGGSTAANAGALTLQQGGTNRIDIRSSGIRVSSSASPGTNWPTSGFGLIQVPDTTGVSNLLAQRSTGNTLDLEILSTNPNAFTLTIGDTGAPGTHWGGVSMRGTTTNLFALTTCFLQTSSVTPTGVQVQATGVQWYDTAGGFGRQDTFAGAGACTTSWGTGATSVTYTQALTSIANGATLSITAQQSTLAASTGGALNLTSGAGAATGGGVTITAGAGASQATSGKIKMVAAALVLGAFYSQGSADWTIQPDSVGITNLILNAPTSGQNIFAVTNASGRVEVDSPSFVINNLAGVSTGGWVFAMALGATYSVTIRDITATAVTFTQTAATAAANAATWTFTAQANTNAGSFDGGKFVIGGGASTNGVYGLLSVASPLDHGYQAFTPVAGAQTLTAAQSAANCLDLLAGVAGAFTITITRRLANAGQIFVRNNTTQTATIQFLTGGAVTLATGTSAFIGSDLTNAKKLMIGT